MPRLSGAVRAFQGGVGAVERSRFFPLRIIGRRAETADAAVFRFAPPAGREADFAFRAGQHLIFRASPEGEEIRRTYSVCSPEGGALQVLIKRVADGRFSNFALDAWKTGGEAEATRPTGEFTVDINPAAPRRVLALAAGSGITPVISILETLLAREPQSDATLLLGNRRVNSVIFRERLSDLKDSHLSRFRAFHILSRERTENPLTRGRMDEKKIGELLDALSPSEGPDLALLCGPAEMMAAARKALTARGVPPERIRRELFAPAPATAGKKPKAAQERPESGAANIASMASISMDGVRRRAPVAAGMTILEAALAAGMEAPFSCRGGVCATCRARITSGAAEMEVNHALEPDELARGFVLTCQARPTTPEITVDFDAR